MPPSPERLNPSKRKPGTDPSFRERSGVSILVPVVLIILALLGILLFTYDPETGFALGGTLPLLGAVAFVLVMADLRIGVVLLILLVGLSPEFTLFGYPQFRAEDFLMPALLLGWFADVNERKISLDRLPLKKPIFVYLVVAGIASHLGITRGTISGGGFSGGTYSLFAWGKMIMYFMMFIIVTTSIRNRNDVAMYAVAMIMANLAVAFMGISQFMTTGEAFSPTRISGPYGEGSNVLGGYFIFHVSLAVGMFVELEDMKYRLLLLGAIALTMVPFLNTFSRTSYVALVGGLTIVGLLRRRAIVVILFVAIVVLPVLLIDPVFERARTILYVFSDNPPSSWEARTSAWRRFTDDIFRYPLIGHGVRSLPFGALDNIYIQVLIDTGFLGLISFLWLLAEIGKMAFDNLKAVSDDPLLRAYSLGFLCGFSGLLVHGLGASSFLSIRTMEPFMIAAGVAAAICMHRKEWLTPVEQVKKHEFNKLQEKGIELPSEAT